MGRMSIGTGREILNREFVGLRIVWDQRLFYPYSMI